MCGDTPNLKGAARASNVYFANAEVAEAASRHLAELMGGVMDVSKSATDRLTPAVPVQSVGATFFMGDSVTQEGQGASTKDPVADASACTTSSEGVLKESKMEDKPTSADDDMSVIVDERCSMQEDSAQSKGSGRFPTSDASTPEKMSKTNDETTATSSSSAVPSVTTDQPDFNRLQLKREPCPQLVQLHQLNLPSREGALVMLPLRQVSETEVLIGS